jgi:hypothetical protein
MIAESGSATTVSSPSSPWVSRSTSRGRATRPRRVRGTCSLVASSTSSAPAPPPGELGAGGSPISTHPTRRPVRRPIVEARRRAGPSEPSVAVLRCHGMTRCGSLAASNGMPARPVSCQRRCRRRRVPAGRETTATPADTRARAAQGSPFAVHRRGADQRGEPGSGGADQTPGRRTAAPTPWPRRETRRCTRRSWSRWRWRPSTLKPAVRTRRRGERAGENVSEALGVAGAPPLREIRSHQDLCKDDLTDVGVCAARRGAARCRRAARGPAWS